MKSEINRSGSIYYAKKNNIRNCCFVSFEEFCKWHTKQYQEQKSCMFLLRTPEELIEKLVVSIAKSKRAEQEAPTWKLSESAVV